MDESSLLVVLTNSLVASETVQPQVTLTLCSGSGLSPIKESQAEALAGIGTFDRELVDVPGIWRYIAPMLLVAPLEGNRPNGLFDVFHHVDFPLVNIVPDGLTENWAGQPLGFKPF